MRRGADIIHALLQEDFTEEQSLSTAEEGIPEYLNSEDASTSKQVQTDVATMMDASTSCNFMALN